MTMSLTASITGPVRMAIPAPTPIEKPSNEPTPAPGTANVSAPAPTTGTVVGTVPAPATGTVPAPATGTVPAPATGTVPAPATGTVPAPATGTVPAPATGTVPAPATGTVNGTAPTTGTVNGTAPAPAIGTAPAPTTGTASGTAPAPATGTADGPVAMSVAAPTVRLHLGNRPVQPVRSAWRDGTRASWVLVPDPTTVPRIRKRVRRQLAEWDVTGCRDTVELLVSETVTNAMRHAWGAVLTLTVEDGTCRCEIRDTNPAMPAVCHAHDGDEGGRGIYLLEVLADRWGARPEPAGKVVWFEIACTTAGSVTHDA